MLRRAADGRLDWRPADGAVTQPTPPGVHALALDGPEALLAVPAGEPRPRPLLVFFHGAGGTAAQGLGATGRALEERGAVLLAPTSVSSTWDLLAGGLGRDVSVLDAALQRAARGVHVSGVAVGGFSDGASYALALGLANGDLFDAVLAFSPGFAAPPVTTGRPRVWITHGSADRVLPAAHCGRRVAGDLRATGYDVTYEEFDGGHVLAPERVARALDWWLAG